MKSTTSLTLCLFAALTSAGCASRELPTKPVAVEPAPAPLSTENAPGVYPGIYRSYYVGPSIDPNNGRILYRGGQVEVQERPERWNLSRRPQQASYSQPRRGPDLSSDSPALYTQPVAAEYEQMLAKAQMVMTSLMAQNDALNREVQHLYRRTSAQTGSSGAGTSAIPAALSVGGNPVANYVPPAPAAGAPTPEPEASAEAKEFVKLVPNSDGVIAMDLALLDPPIPGEVNPFIQRYQPKTELRKLELRVSSLAIGPKPSVVINSRLLSRGQLFEGFTVHDITNAGVILRRDSFLLEIPISLKAVTIQMP